MLVENRIALKEWAVVCAAMAAGRQAISLRKGGLDEGPDGFRVQHPEFWLLPTQFHEGRESLTPDAEPLLADTLANLPPPGKIRIAQYVVVDEVRHVTILRRSAMRGLHIWSDDTVRRRFEYRQPGLNLLLLRVYQLLQPLLVSDTPQIAGCRSWVELPSELPTGGATPVLNDEEFAAVREAVERAIGS